MKTRLVILSDMWGLDHSAWMDRYLRALDPAFRIQLYDVRVLGNVATGNSDEAVLHAAFVHGGIDAAASKLLELEPEQVDILAFSVGGTIAWKAGMKGMSIGHLYAVSSTRLRLQTAKPHCTIQLFHGADDPYQAPGSWYAKLKLDPPQMESGGHTFYAAIDPAKRICDAILSAHNKALSPIDE